MNKLQKATIFVL